jgi:hypothetical protein
VQHSIVALIQAPLSARASNGGPFFTLIPLYSQIIALFLYRRLIQDQFHKGQHFLAIEGL